MSATILILRAGSEPNDTWAPELEEIGYTVLYAEDVPQAKVHLDCANAVDIVVIDSAERENAALTAFSDMLAQMPIAPRVVLVSGSPSAPAFSVKLGAAAFLPKPCDSGDLAHVLRRMSTPMNRSGSVRASI